MMFNLNSCIEVFGVQVEPQLSVLFAAINKAVESLCQFTFFDLRYNDISCLVHMNSFKSVEDWRPMMAGPRISVT